MKLIVFVKAFSFYREYSDVYERTKQSSYICNEKVIFVLITFSKMCIASLCFMSLLHIYFFLNQNKTPKILFFRLTLK